MTAIQRMMIGAVGGAIAVASKVMALDIGQLTAFLDGGDLAAAGQLRVTIYIFAPLLIFSGAAIAWASKETKPMTLISIGCAAPALVAPWTTGALPKGDLQQVAFNVPAIVSTAHAQEGNPPASGDAGKISALEFLFGLKEPSDARYWVIVGSYKNLQKAHDFRDELNRLDPSIDAFVGKQKPGNPHYPVIVGGEEAFLPIGKARELQDKAQGISIVPDDTFLSNYAGRLPNPAIP